MSNRFTFFKPQKRWHQRLLILIFSLLAIIIALITILSTFNDNIIFFFSPKELNDTIEGKKIRLGGMIKKDSVKYLHNDSIEFIITDFEQEVTVHYSGIIPALFREESSAVAQGKLRNGAFYAEEILAKHDEKYMPKEVADALRQ